MLLVTEIQTFLQSPERIGEVIGLVGASVYIGGFFLLQTGRVCGNSVAYALSKVFAAVLVLISLITAFNLASFVIQIAYGGIGIYGALDRARWRQRADTKRKNAPKTLVLRASMKRPRQRGAVSDLA